jgi:hypothetical protein
VMMKETNLEIQYNTLLTTKALHAEDETVPLFLPSAYQCSCPQVCGSTL